MLDKIGNNIYALRSTPILKKLYSVIRNKRAKRDKFKIYSQKIFLILTKNTLHSFPANNKNAYAVSILRSGLAMENAVKKLLKGIKIGHILTKRNEKTLKAKLYYYELPKDISKKQLFLLDPMIATGGSACKAIALLKQKGVKENKIVFVSLISAPQGLKRVHSAYPGVKIITGAVDHGLDSKGYVVPGLGDFGDRYFGK